MSSHCPVGLVTRQWDAVDWACVLCDSRIHNDRASRSDSSRHCACPFYSFRADVFWQSITTLRSFSPPPYSPDLAPCYLQVFLKAKIAFEMEEICECDGHTEHKLSQRRLTANWLVPREGGCSQVHSIFSSDWLPSYIKTKRPVLGIFIMDGYFLDTLRMCVYCILTLTLWPGAGHLQFSTPFM